MRGGFLNVMYIKGPAICMRMNVVTERDKPQASPFELDAVFGISSRLSPLSPSLSLPLSLSLSLPPLFLYPSLPPPLVLSPCLPPLFPLSQSAPASCIYFSDNQSALSALIIFLSPGLLKYWCNPSCLQRPVREPPTSLKKEI